MRTRAAAKGRRLFFLAAVCLASALLLSPAAEASRSLPAALAPTLTAPATPDQVLEGELSDPPERLRLFDDLRLPPRPLELVEASKTATGVKHYDLGLNIRQTGGLSRESGGLSFQGLWTDPVTGISYARNRWYDARTASWLSEDPKGAVDSPNLYAFVGWGPHVGTDPLGKQALPEEILTEAPRHWREAAVVYESTAVGVSAATGWSLGAIAGAGAIVVGSVAAVGTDIYLGVELYKTNQGVKDAEQQAEELAHLLNYNVRRKLESQGGVPETILPGDSPYRTQLAALGSDDTIFQAVRNLHNLWVINEEEKAAVAEIRLLTAELTGNQYVTFRDILTDEEMAKYEEIRWDLPEWMPGLDDPATPLSTSAEVKSVRRKVRVRGHHRHPIAFGGEPNPEEGLVQTGEHFVDGRKVTNPHHTKVTNFWNGVLRRIRSQDVQ